MNSAISSETQDFTTQAKKAGLARWKLETLTGLLQYRAANHHQREREKNIEAENSRVRKELWGDDRQETAGDDMGNTILGDYHPPQVIVTGQQQSSGIGQLLGAAAIGASLLGIPGAGVAAYMLGKAQQQPATNTTIEKIEDVGLGLLKFEDLKK
jgi:hypothetical protein